jgi:hypothetical protein
MIPLGTMKIATGPRNAPGAPQGRHAGDPLRPDTASVGFEGSSPLPEATSTACRSPQGDQWFALNGAVA